MDNLAVLVSDPVYKCIVYTSIGCSHVDGYLCDMSTCNILKDFKKDAKEKKL